MRAGIITCHDVFNFGATLQAYALSNVLKEAGINVEIIDYQPGYLYRLIDFMEVDAPKWRISALRRWIYRIYTFPQKANWIIKYLRFKKFQKENYNLSDCCTSLEELKKLAYDVGICGSDQVWNSVKYPCGEDPAFYLAFQSGGRKVSYAASFGGKTVSGKGEQLLKTYLPSFNAISVREASGVDLLQQFSLSAVHVLDPVFLLNKARWRRLEKWMPLPKKYFLVYGYDNSEELTLAVSHYAEKLDCEVISMQEGRLLHDAGPREFLTLVDQAEMVITTSFHAVAFSIILNTPFVAVKTKNVELYERIEDLLKTTGLEDCCWDVARKTGEYSVDFHLAEERLAPMINKSKAFLSKAVWGDISSC